MITNSFQVFRSNPMYREGVYEFDRISACMSAPDVPEPERLQMFARLAMISSELAMIAVRSSDAINVAARNVAARSSDARNVAARSSDARSSDAINVAAPVPGHNTRPPPSALTI
jgi:hypothetical protein